MPDGGRVFRDAPRGAPPLPGAHAIEAPGRTGTARDDASQLARAVESLGLDVARIVPVHGRPGTMADLRPSLARRGVRTAGR